MKKVLPKHAALIPENAVRAFNGDIFDVYQWPQKMFDGTTKTFEMLRRPDTVQVIAIDSGQIILIDDEQPGRPAQLHFPGGRVDEEDTSWLTAAQRELLEETGLEFTNWRLISVEQPIIKIEWFTPIYLATDLSKTVPQKPDVSGEKIRNVPTDFNKAREMILSGKYPAVSYLIPLFSRTQSIQQLYDLPEFKGQVVDR